VGYFLWLANLGLAHTNRQSYRAKAFSEKQLTDLKELEGKNSAMPFVRANLASQVEANSTLLTTQTERFDTYVLLIWVVPLILFVFCWGIPWVAAGFGA